ncbi:MAG: alginate lyase family protein [Thermoguttaceae bacterium]|jgi:hypothetical protein
MPPTLIPCLARVLVFVAGIVLSPWTLQIAFSADQGGKTTEKSPEPKAQTPDSTNRPFILPKNFAFSHPMIVINRAELAAVKRRIADKVEPQATAFAQLICDADAAQSFVPDPPETMDIMGGYEPNNNQETVIRPWLWRNGHAAYCSALAYACTGKTNYADKAVEILNAWAAKKTTFTGRDRGLQLGSWFSQMLYAADLLHDYAGWKAADRERFNSWWRTNCLVHTYPIAIERRNNWKDAGLLGVMSAAMVLEDKKLLADGLKELDNYFDAHTDKRNNMTNEWKIKKDENGVYLVSEVGRNDGRSGITYTAYALTTMVQNFEIARYAGFDFWHRRTQTGATLQDVIEQYFRWDILKQPFPWNANPDRLPTRKNPYEIANNHFKLDPQIIDWLKANRPVNGAQGDEYVTLNKGDLSPPPAK